MNLSRLRLLSSPFSTAYTVRSGIPEASESSLRLSLRDSLRDLTRAPASAEEVIFMSAYPSYVCSVLQE